MLNLIIKDIQIQKKDKTMWIFMLLNLINIYIYQKNPNMSVFIFFISIYILVIYANAYDFKYHSQIFINSLPVQREIVVTSKYLSILVYYFCAIFITMVFGNLVHFWIPSAFSKVFSMNTILLELFVILIYFMVYFPIYFKFGYLKSRWLNFFMMTILGGIIGVQKYMNLLSLSIMIVCSLVLFIISIFVSFSIYLKKEF